MTEEWTVECQWESKDKVTLLRAVAHRFIFHGVRYTNTHITVDSNLRINGIRLCLPGNNFEIRKFRPADFQFQTQYVFGAIRHVYTLKKDKVALVAESRLTNKALEFDEEHHQNMLTNATRILINTTTCSSGAGKMYTQTKDEHNNP